MLRDVKTQRRTIGCLARGAVENPSEEQSDSQTPPTNQQVGHAAINVHAEFIHPSIVEAVHDRRPRQNTQEPCARAPRQQLCLPFQ